MSGKELKENNFTIAKELLKNRFFQICINQEYKNKKFKKDIVDRKRIKIILKNIKIKSKKRNLDIGETVMQLTEEEQAVVSVIFHNRVEEDIQCFMDHRLSMFGSDGNAVSKNGFYKDGKPHPRFYGTFPRILGRYIREKRSKLSLEEAIYKMTGFPAWRLGLKQRGEIKKNYIADITIFNPEKVIDKATFKNPHQYSEGMKTVIVNGQISVINGKKVKGRHGKVIRSFSD